MKNILKLLIVVAFVFSCVPVNAIGPDESKENYVDSINVGTRSIAPPLEVGDSSFIRRDNRNSNTLFLFTLSLLGTEQ